MAASFGEQLRLAREARGISLREISEQTRISTRYLEAIEANDYKRLPGGIFNRSFIKAYARHIGFDEKEALEAYARTAREQGADEVATTPYQSHVYTDGGSTRSPLVTLLLSILILSILILGVYAAQHWYRRRSAESTDNSSAPAQQQQQNVRTQPTPAVDSALTNASGLQIQVTARGGDVWVGVLKDAEKKSRGIILRQDKTETFSAEQSLKIQYAASKADALEVTINGRRARVPADKPVMLITKENYAQYLQ